MMAFKLLAVLLFLCSIQAGRAIDPLDTWTWRNPLPTGSTPSGIAYGNGQFAAVGFSGAILTSTDRAIWIQRRLGISKGHDLNGIAYGNGQFVAVGDYGAIVTSTDGVNWVESQSGSFNRLYAIAYGNGQFVAADSAVARTAA
jgi:hypothetical protein